MSSMISAVAATRCTAGCPGLAQVLAGADPGWHGNRALAVAALITWVLTASIGAYMLSRLIASGGVRRQREVRGGLSPAFLFWHFSLALTGLALWLAYVISGWPPLAWAAVVLLGPVAGLGLSTVTLWSPYPTPGGAGPAGGRLAAPGEDVLTSRITDATLTRALTDEALAARLVEEVLAGVMADPARRRRRGPKGQVAALVPAGHGMLAITTILLAVLAAVATL
ncbi:MAG TPA: hypothetical protein VIX86_22825 [Streptosporangiaceae bacterium]